MQDIIPKGFRIKLPMESYNMTILSKKVSFTMINESIEQAYKKLAHLQGTKQELQQRLLRALDQQQYRKKN